MAPRIDPRFPLVWRSPDELQLGSVPAAAVIGCADDAVQGLLSALRAGASRPALEGIAGALGAATGTVDRLLEDVRGALDPAWIDVDPADGAGAVASGTARRRRPRRPRIAVDGD
ncbi:hypothetical protein GB864_17575, partial [Agromyces sp. MMS17-SY077]|nr:hypothetical protein [Agromyces seonyuensis]